MSNIKCTIFVELSNRVHNVVLEYVKSGTIKVLINCRNIHNFIQNYTKMVQFSISVVQKEKRIKQLVPTLSLIIQRLQQM